jgi:hypothetical protein
LKLEVSCWNVDFAVAGFETPPVTEPDGVEGSWYIRCERNTRPWSCEPATRERSVEVSVIKDGKTNKFLGQLPVGLSGSRGRALVTAAATVAIEPQMTLPGCDSRENEEFWSRFWLRPRPDVELSAVVDLTGAATEVMIDSSVLIRFGTDDQPVCWEGLVVIT